MSSAVATKDEAASARPRVGICAIAKNESPYLAEWAIYHKLIGFDDILVYDHQSTDDSRAVLQKLQSAGFLRYQPWDHPSDGNAQKRAYADGLLRNANKLDWICFIDLDEFVVIPELDDIHAFIQTIPDLDALAINWKLFGTSGHERWTDGLVIERFTMCGVHDSGNRAVKTLAKTDRLVQPNLHNHSFAEGVVYQTINGDVIPPNMGKSATVSHDRIRINHYFTKSREVWDAKVARGRETKPADSPDHYRREKHFQMHNKNDCVDAYMSKFIAPIREQMKRLEI